MKKEQIVTAVISIIAAMIAIEVTPSLSKFFNFSPIMNLLSVIVIGALLGYLLYNLFVNFFKL